MKLNFKYILTLSIALAQFSQNAIFGFVLPYPSKINSNIQKRTNCHLQTVSRLSMTPVDSSNFIVNMFNGFGVDINTFNNFISSSMIQGQSVEDGIGPAKEAAGSLIPLGNDLLIFLCATIGIVPLFKWLKASPVLGYLSAGLLMGPAFLGLFSDLHDLEALADFGVLFLLFEQGLELTFERLKNLSKYAFGMGSLQVLLSTFAFFVFPFIGGVQFLEFIVGSDPSVVDIRREDEALVIGAALSLSSSAFVLKILQEKNQLSTKFGAASLGILLFQDIAVVPLLVLLPIIENSSGPTSLEAQLTVLGLTLLKAIFGLGGILVIGGRVVRYLFSVVAKTKSSETFVALCLLVALGTGGITDALGLSSTLGAFTAGTLLAESNYRTQIESDIKPFRGLLLGLFFMTTGASVEPSVIQEQWPTVIALVGGLIAFKTAIVSFLGKYFDLTLSESIRTGLLLSGGGEFAFVVLTLADKLDVIPNQLAKILVGVVVISMALTPYLSKFGDSIADRIELYERNKKMESQAFRDTLSANEDGDEGLTFLPSKGSKKPAKDTALLHDRKDDVIVICGYSHVGEVIVKFLKSPKILEYLKKKVSSNSMDYLVFDLDPTIVMNGYKKGEKILYGDGSQPMVLATAGIQSPKAFIITYDDSEESAKAVERLRQTFPTVPILARATEIADYFHLLEVGATSAQLDERETSLQMGSMLLKDLFQVDWDIIRGVRKDIREEIDLGDITILEEIRIKKTGTRSIFNNDRLNLSDKIKMRFNPNNNSTINKLKSIDVFDTEAVVETLSDMAATVNNLIGSTVSQFKSDRPVDDPFLSNMYRDKPANSNTTIATSSYKNDVNPKEVNDASSDMDLGVTVCILPAKKGESPYK